MNKIILPQQVFQFMLTFSLEITTLSRSESIDFISTIPTNTTHLSLGICTGSTPEELAEFLAALPESIISIRFYGSAFWCGSGTELAQIFQSIKKNVDYLSLKNFLVGMESAELKIAFSGLQNKNITHLNLSDNSGLRGIKDIVEALSSIPSTVTCLELAESCRKEDPPDRSAYQILENTPESVSELVLYGTNFEFLKNSQSFSIALPRIHTITLSFEAIKNLSQEEHQRLKTIVPNIKNIIFVNNCGWKVFNEKKAETIYLQQTFGIKKIPTLYDAILFKVSNYSADEIIPSVKSADSESASSHLPRFCNLTER